MQGKTRREVIKLPWARRAVREMVATTRSDSLRER